VITGCHSILIDEYTSKQQREEVFAFSGDIYITDDRYRLPACLDPRAKVYDKAGTYTIYHIALENDVPKCFKLGDHVVAGRQNMLETFYQNGQIVKSSDNIDTIRERVNYWRGVYDF
jgi:nicotinic acid phosphoribosyltransferase